MQKLGVFFMLHKAEAQENYSVLVTGELQIEITGRR